MNRHKRVACFSPYPEVGPSVRHRILALAPHWRSAGFDLIFYPFMGTRFYQIRKRLDLLGTLLKTIHFAWSTVLTLFRASLCWRFDIVIIHREVFPLGPPWVEWLVCKIAKRTIFDLDDAIWNPPTQTLNQRGVFWYPQRTQDIVRNCYAVIVGNAYLQEYVQQAVDHLPACATPIFVVPTGYDDLSTHPLHQYISRQKALRSAPIVVWIGSEGNAEYLLPLLPVLLQVHNQHPFILRLVGGADIFQIEHAGLTIERQLWTLVGEAQALLESDIGIMPLPDNPYEQGKCGFKLVQYWSAGLPVVASPVGVNKSYVDGNNGLLAKGSEDWLAALSTLLNSSMLRHTMGQAGHATYQRRFTRQKCAQAWIPLLEVSPK
jgi:glycosyltransferase involved in cell wall biosynthesis